MLYDDSHNYFPLYCYYQRPVLLSFCTYRPLLLKRFSRKVRNFHLQFLLQLPMSQNATQRDHMTALDLLIIPLSTIQNFTIVSLTNSLINTHDLFILSHYPSLSGDMVPFSADSLYRFI